MSPGIARRHRRRLAFPRLAFPRLAWAGLAWAGLVGTVAVALVAAACTPARANVAPERASAKVRGTVVLTGDSLTVGELGSLPPAAEARGIRLTIAAQVGRTTAAGTAALKDVYDHPDLVVVALGTNDATADLTGVDADAMIDAALAVVDADIPVLWLTIYRYPQSPGGLAADRFNLALRRAANRHPNLAIADWRAYLVGHLDLLAPDGVHLTDAGYVARTGWLVGQIAARLPSA